jgi:hypothetical protein
MFKGGVKEGASPPLFIFLSPSPRLERGTKGVRLINKKIRVWEEKYRLRRGVSLAVTGSHLWYQYQ